MQSLTKGPGNAIKRLCGTRSGSSPPAFLDVHSALVVSRITRGLIYMQLSGTQGLILERVHHAQLKTALGVPRQMPTSEIFAETGVLPIVEISRNRLLGHSLRLHNTPLGRRQWEKEENRPESPAVPIFWGHA